MSAINTSRVVAGGLLAGVVANAVNVGTQSLTTEDMTAMVQQLHLDPAVMSDVSHAIPWIVVNFVYGILIVLNYAAMRPRFGPGPKTALLAGFMLYAAVTVILYGFMTMGVFSEPMFVKSALIAAVSTALASLAGGWAYKE